MADKQLTGAQILLKALMDQGVEVIFGYPGGAVLPIYDEIFKQNKIRHILVRQEGGAVHAAEGYARSTGKVGVVLVTSGPGATNAVTGLTDAFMDSVPVICLTGQVPTHLIGNDAFQEADTTGITRPCTKHNYLVKDVNRLARTVHEAFHVALSGRPGPIVIDLPKDVCLAIGTYVSPAEARHATYHPRTKGDSAQIRRAVEIMAKAKRPLFYCGGGVINSGPRASKLLTELVNLTGYPCTLTLMGLGAVPAADKHYLGMVGMHGLYEANNAMHDCDVMINIGARFDDRPAECVFARLDQDSRRYRSVFDQQKRARRSQHRGRCRVCAGRHDQGMEGAEREARCQGVAGVVAPDRPVAGYEQSGKVIKPQYAIQRLYEMTRKRKDVFITTEVGQHQMWAAQFYRFEQPNHWMTSGGLGTMGYGLPSAMGVQIAHPKALVVDIAGEASILMNIQELSTIAQYRLPVKVFILNNEYMGMVRQWQELLHGGRYAESYMESLPDFVKLAESFHAVGLRASSTDDLDKVIAEMIATDRPVIADIRVDKKENCFPMIPSGAAHNEMLLGPADRSARPVSEEGMVLV